MLDRDSELWVLYSQFWDSISIALSVFCSHTCIFISILFIYGQSWILSVHIWPVLIPFCTYMTSLDSFLYIYGQSLSPFCSYMAGLESFLFIYDLPWFFFVHTTSLWIISVHFCQDTYDSVHIWPVSVFSAHKYNAPFWSFKGQAVFFSVYIWSSAFLFCSYFRSFHSFLFINEQFPIFSVHTWSASFFSHHLVSVSDFFCSFMNCFYSFPLSAPFCSYMIFLSFSSYMNSFCIRFKSNRRLSKQLIWLMFS